MYTERFVMDEVIDGLAFKEHCDEEVYAERSRATKAENFKNR